MSQNELLTQLSFFQMRLREVKWLSKVGKWQNWNEVYLLIFNMLSTFCVSSTVLDYENAVLFQLPSAFTPYLASVDSVNSDS